MLWEIPWFWSWQVVEIHRLIIENVKSWHETIWLCTCFRFCRTWVWFRWFFYCVPGRIHHHVSPNFSKPKTSIFPKCIGKRAKLGGGNSTIFYFHHFPREMIQFDKYFSDGLKPPTSKDSEKSLWFSWFFSQEDDFGKTIVVEMDRDC